MGYHVAFMRQSKLQPATERLDDNVSSLLVPNFEGVAALCVYEWVAFIGKANYVSSQKDEIIMFDL